MFERIGEQHWVGALSHGHFALYGLDVLVDARLRLWFNEMNFSPGLADALKRAFRQVGGVSALLKAKPKQAAHGLAALDHRQPPLRRSRLGRLFRGHPLRALVNVTCLLLTAVL